MKSNITQNMLCPCCGNLQTTDLEVCPSCQAHKVDEPIVQPAFKLPSLGPALLAFTVPIVIVLAFFSVWFFGNDMKVARILMVSVLGESTLFSKSLLQADPDLFSYRIFTFDAYRLACFMSIGLIPLSLIGIWLARRANRLIKFDPTRFGGQRLVAASLLLSSVWFLAFSAAGISSIPRALHNGRAKHMAETRAKFYELHSQALTSYYAQYGTYPQELKDLRTFVPDVIPQVDYWGNVINYTPSALIASKNTTPGYSTYQLVSAGPDNILGTYDDIRMIDGVIVNASDEDDWLSDFFSPKRNEKTIDR